MSRGFLYFNQQSLNKLSLNSGKDGIVLLHKKSKKAKINSNGARTYSANNVVQKIKFIEASRIEG